MARKIVIYYRINHKVGNVYYHYDSDSSSNETKFLIKKEEKRLLNKAQSNANYFLNRHVEEHNAHVYALLDHNICIEDKSGRSLII